MIKLKKKICVVVCVSLLLNVISYENMCLADDYESDNEEIFVEESFVDDRNQYEYIDKKIEDDLKDETGIVSSELEKKLNEQGYFDDDIEMLSEDDIILLEESDLSDSVVYSEYYAVPDIKELENTSINESMIQLNSEEVDMLIESKYYGNENNLDEVVYERVSSDEVEKDNLIDKSLKAIGLIPETVYADYTTSVGGVNDKKHYCYLKKTLFFAKTKIYYHTHDNEKKYYYQLVCTMTWTKMPVNRLLDIYQLSWDGLAYERAGVSEREDWRAQGVDLNPRVIKAHDTETFYVEKSGDGSQKAYSMNRNIKKEQKFKGCYRQSNVELVNGEYAISRYGLIGANDLINDRSKSTDTRIYYTNYYNETIKIIVYLKPFADNEAAIYTDYKHSKMKATINAGVVLKVVVAIKQKDWKEILIRPQIIDKYLTYTEAGANIGGWSVYL